MQTGRRLHSLSFAAGLLLTAGLTAGLPAVLAAQEPASQDQENWRQTMHHTSAPQNGCFHASYPSTSWAQVACTDPPAYRSAHPKLSSHEQVAGNGFDYVAQAPSGHFISAAVGSFPTVSKVTSETGANVPFGSGESSGITGKNQYTLQVNTNIVNTRACNGYTACRAWQQYVISTDTPVSLTSSQLSNKTEVFIEYWLLNYGQHTGKNICPTGFIDGGEDSEGPGDDCVQNTPAVVLYSGQLPITQLASLTLSGTAVAGGTDKATATLGTEAYTATVADSLTDISSAWSQAEFNVVGNAGGSRADFNSGASLTVKIALTDGSTTAPTCTAPSSYDGTTGETNNLTLKSCSGTGGSAPAIVFVESD